MNLIAEKTEHFTEAYSNYYALVFSSIYSRVGSTDEAKDICQEVFIKFYEKFHEIENSRKWLLGALRLSVFEFYRKKGKKDSIINAMFKDMSLTFVNGFRDSRLIIEEAFEDMDTFQDEREKILFDLIAIYDYTYREAGRELGYSVRQARYRYGLIVERLVRYFRKRGIYRLEDLL